ncbi:MAG TPA: DUF5681 domain-containing protein [Allosphingosinicella sp.]|jgi:hypothetical protein
MADYPVGYGKPPKHSQFQKGESGNPKGRPRASKGLKTELREELSELVSVTIDGKTRRVSKRRLVIKALAAKAAKGNVPAADKLLSLVIQAEGFEDQRPAARQLSDTDRRILQRLLGEEEPSDAADGEQPDG